MWTAQQIDLLKQLWTAGKSAAQIAAQVGNTRSAVCAKLQRLGLNRAHKPPTAKPRIVSRPTRSARRSIVSQGAPTIDRRSTLPLRSLRKVIAPRKAATSAPVELTKSQLRALRQRLLTPRCIGAGL